MFVTPPILTQDMAGHPKFPGKPAADDMITVAEVNEETTLSPNITAPYKVKNASEVFGFQSNAKSC